VVTPKRRAASAVLIILMAQSIAFSKTMVLETEIY
jgi:hypothetical protein